MKIQIRFSERRRKNELPEDCPVSMKPVAE